MTKLLLLLAILASPAPDYTSTQIHGHAEMCCDFSGGADCQEAWADTANEICWCTLVDYEWLYCGCMEPRNMSKQEYLEYLIYLGKDNEVQI